MYAAMLKKLTAQEMHRLKRLINKNFFAEFKRYQTLIVAHHLSLRKVRVELQL